MSDPDWTYTDLELARDILRYLLDRPEARDSVEAIATWWIPRQRLEVAVSAVQRVIERLAEDSLVLEYDDPPGYGINAERLDDVKGFIEAEKRLESQ